MEKEFKKGRQLGHSLTTAKEVMKEFKLSEKVHSKMPGAEEGMLLVIHVKEFIRRIKAKGEVLRNGAFIINYKEMCELAGDLWCTEGHLRWIKGGEENDK